MAVQLGLPLSDIDAMSAEDAATWYQYLKTDMMPMKRIEWLLAGLLAVTMNGNLKKGKKPYKAQDFIFGFEKPKQRVRQAVPSDELAQKFRSIFSGSHNPATG